MTLFFEVDEGVTNDLPFDVEELGKQVAQAVLESENCPYETSVAILLTDNAGIQELNREYRGIDRETDVLSFPNIDFDEAGDFAPVEEREADYFDPDSGELLLGDIILSIDRIKEQAESYGHSLKRECAFLIAHSMFHLCGYDHMEEQEEKVMVEKQEKVLTDLGITRQTMDSSDV